MGTFSYYVHEQLKKEYGDIFFVSEVKSMTPEQIIRAANKHLPSIIELQLHNTTYTLAEVEKELKMRKKRIR
jgi:hypothetical protein